jgi:hypothetical protein
MTSIIKVDQIQTAAGGVPTAGDLGLNTTGTVLQVVQTYNEDSSHIVASSTGLVASGIQASITPKQAGSLILVSFNTTMVHAQSSAYIRGRMYVNGSFMGSPGQYHLGYQDYNSYYHPWVFNGKYTATNTNSLMFEPYYQGDGNLMRLVHVNASYALTLTEIAG